MGLRYTPTNIPTDGHESRQDSTPGHSSQVATPTLRGQPTIPLITNVAFGVGIVVSVDAGKPSKSLDSDLRVEFKNLINFYCAPNLT